MLELLLEAHVWEDDGSLLARERERLFEIEVPLLHQIRDDAGGGSRHAGVTVHEDGAATRHCILDESYRCREVSQQTLVRAV